MNDFQASALPDQHGSDKVYSLEEVDVQRNLDEAWDEQFMSKNVVFSPLARIIKQDPELIFDLKNGFFTTDFGNWTFSHLLKGNAFDDALERLKRITDEQAKKDLEQKDELDNTALHTLLQTSFHENGLFKLVQLIVEKCESANPPFKILAEEGEDQGSIAGTRVVQRDGAKTL